MLTSYVADNKKFCKPQLILVQLQLLQKLIQMIGSQQMLNGIWSKFLLNKIIMLMLLLPLMMVQLVALLLHLQRKVWTVFLFLVKMAIMQRLTELHVVFKQFQFGKIVVNLVVLLVKSHLLWRLVQNKRTLRVVQCLPLQVALS